MILSAHAGFQRQEGSRLAQTTINLGSGRRAAVVAGQQWRNAHTAALVGQEGGGGHTAVVVGRRQGIGGGEG
jgi:hypothetical protein